MLSKWQKIKGWRDIRRRNKISDQDLVEKTFEREGREYPVYIEQSHASGDLANIKLRQAEDVATLMLTVRTNKRYESALCLKKNEMKI